MLLAAGELVEICEDVIASDDSVPERNENVARFRLSALIGIDHNTCAFYGFVVNFASMTLKRAYQVQMGSWAKQTSIEKRFVRGSAGADHVRLARAGLGADRFHFDCMFVTHFLTKRFQIGAM